MNRVVRKCIDEVKRRAGECECESCQPIVLHDWSKLNKLNPEYRLNKDWTKKATYSNEHVYIFDAFTNQQLDRYSINDERIESKMLIDDFHFMIHEYVLSVDKVLYGKLDFIDISKLDEITGKYGIYLNCYTYVEDGFKSDIACYDEFEFNEVVEYIEKLKEKYRCKLYV